MIASLINGTSYLTVLLGGHLADAVLGRGKTVLFASGLACAGLMLLTVSAAVATTLTSHVVDLALFLSAEGCIALAFGGIKPNVSPLGADQFDDFHPITGKPLNDKERFFGWYYFFINVGALLAATLLVWVQTSVSWTLGFALPTAIALAALTAFVAGWRGYRLIPPGEAPLKRIAQVCVLAFRNRHLALPTDPLDLYEEDHPSSDEEDEDVFTPPPLMHTPTLAALDKAAVVPPGESWPLPHEPRPTAFVSVTQVEEAKQVGRLLPVLLTWLVWNLCYAQLGTIMVQQADMCDRRLGGGGGEGDGGFIMPAASITIFSTITILILVPLWDRAFRPALEKRNWAPTTLQRCAVSQVMMAVAMGIASAVEAWRGSVQVAREAAGAGNHDISVMWLVPQIAALGVSEFFFIGAIEFFYQQAPERMRSLASSLELVNYGVASYVGAGLLGVVGAHTDWLPGSGPRGEGRLDLYYAMLAGLAAVNAAIFIWPVASLYRYREFVPPDPLGKRGAAPTICHTKSMVSMPASYKSMVVAPRRETCEGEGGLVGAPLSSRRPSWLGGALRPSSGGGGATIATTPSAMGGMATLRRVDTLARTTTTVNPYATREHRANRLARAETARSATLSRRTTAAGGGSPGWGGSSLAATPGRPGAQPTPPASARRGTGGGRRGTPGGSAHGGGGAALAALAEERGGGGGGGGGDEGAAQAPPTVPPLDLPPAAADRARRLEGSRTEPPPLPPQEEEQEE